MRADFGVAYRAGFEAGPPTTSAGELVAKLGIDADIVWNGNGLSVAGGGETLIPGGPGPATMGNALDRDATVLNGLTLAATYDLPGLADLLAVATAAEVQPGAGNLLWSFVLRVGAGVTPTGDIASNTDGVNGWRLAWAAGELVLFTQPGAINASIDSMGMAGLPVGEYIVCSFLRNATTGVLYACDDRSERALVTASAVAVPSNTWDNTALFTIGNGTAGGGAAGFAGSELVAAIRWTGAQLDAYDGPALVDHTRAIASLTVAVSTVQQASGAAMLETITDGIDAVRATVVLDQNPALVPTALLAGVRTGIDHLVIVEQSPAYRESGTAAIAGGYLITFPQTFGAGYVDVGLRSQWLSSGNTTLTVDAELGLGLTLIPPDGGTVLVIISSVQPAQALVNELDVHIQHSETVLPGFILDARIVYTSTNNVTLTPISGTFYGSWARRSR